MDVRLACQISYHAPSIFIARKFATGTIHGRDTSEQSETNERFDPSRNVRRKNRSRTNSTNPLGWPVFTTYVAMHGRCGHRVCYMRVSGTAWKNGVAPLRLPTTMLLCHRMQKDGTKTEYWRERRKRETKREKGKDLQQWRSKNSELDRELWCTARRSTLSTKLFPFPLTVLFLASISIHFHVVDTLARFAVAGEERKIEEQ